MSSPLPAPPLGECHIPAASPLQSTPPKRGSGEGAGISSSAKAISFSPKKAQYLVATRLPSS